MNKEINKILIAGTEYDIRDSRFDEASQAETTRQSAEQGRVTAEQQRADAEAARAEEFATFEGKIAAKEDVANKVTTINADADDAHYPSAKAVKDKLTELENELYTYNRAEKDLRTNRTTPENTYILLQKNLEYDIYYKSGTLGSASEKIALYYTDNLFLIKEFTAKQVYDGVSCKFTPAVNGNLFVRMNQVGIDVHVSAAYKDKFIMEGVAEIEENTNKNTTDISNIEVQLSDISEEKDLIISERKNFIISATTVETHYDFYVRKGVKNYIYFKYNANCQLRLYKDDTVNLLKDYGTKDWSGGVVLELDVPKDADYNFFRIRSSQKGTVQDLKVYYNSKVAKTDLDAVRDATNIWLGKTAVAYGDSITAQGNTGSGGYSSVVAECLKLEMLCRGVGGQTFKWNDNTFWAYADGSYAGREGQGTQPSGTTTHRGCFCSWDRITTMIPESKKNDVNLILLMGGTNDHSSVEDVAIDGTIDSSIPVWSSANTTDMDWSSSSLYNGGDFDVNTFVGGIASTIMKMQIWCPNAVIVMCTPLARWNVDTKSQYTANGKNLKDVSDIIINSARYMDIPYIDTNSIVGINVFNYSRFISDGVHPNADGQKLLGNAIVANLSVITPRL